MSIKDLIEVGGVRTTFGSLLRQDYVPEQDAVLVQRLRAAGCPIFAKTNTPDHGGKPTTDNAVFGATNNPWNLSRSPGGSPGGAAAQVAAGMGPLAVGNDGGGSIRVPASMCGVYGLKPQFGRIPSWPRHNGWYTLNHEGPIARTVRDAAAMLDIMAGPDERDWNSLPSEAGSYLEACDSDVSGMRVAWSPTPGYGRVDPVVLEHCQAAVRAFEELGCIVEEVSPQIPNVDQIYLGTIVPRLLVQFEQEFPPDFAGQLDPAVASFLPLGDQMSTRDVIAAMYGGYVWRLCMAAMYGGYALRDLLAAFFQQYDLFLTPTMATPPLRPACLVPLKLPGSRFPARWSRSSLIPSTSRVSLLRASQWASRTMACRLACRSWDAASWRRPSCARRRALKRLAPGLIGGRRSSSAECYRIGSGCWNMLRPAGGWLLAQRSALLPMWLAVAR